MEAFAESDNRGATGGVFSPMTSMNDTPIPESNSPGAESNSPDATRGAQVFIGLAIILLGLGFLFERMDLWHVHLSRHFWPFFPLFFGLARLFDAPRTRRRGRTVRGGMWMIYIGIWGFLTEFHVFGLDYDTSWPLLVIGAGLNMVWRSFQGPGVRRIEGN